MSHFQSENHLHNIVNNPVGRAGVALMNLIDGFSVSSDFSEQEFPIHQIGGLFQ
jgi:hypothetical protein